MSIYLGIAWYLVGGIVLDWIFRNFADSDVMEESPLCYCLIIFFLWPLVIFSIVIKSNMKGK